MVETHWSDIYVSDKGRKLRQSSKHCVINTGIGQIKQSEGMELQMVWLRFKEWKWAGREISDVEGDQFRCFIILWETLWFNTSCQFLLEKRVYFYKRVLPVDDSFFNNQTHSEINLLYSNNGC